MRGERYASCSLTLQGANGVVLAPAGCRAAGAVGPGIGRAGGKQDRAGGCPGQGREGQGGQDGRGWVRSQPCLSKSLAPRRKSGNISSSNSGSSRRRRRAGAAEGGRRLSPRGDVEGGEAACGAGRLSASPGLRVCALLHPSFHLSLPPLSRPPARCRRSRAPGLRQPPRAPPRCPAAAEPAPAAPAAVPQPPHRQVRTASRRSPPYRIWGSPIPGGDEVAGAVREPPGKRRGGMPPPAPGMLFAIRPRTLRRGDGADGDVGGASPYSGMRERRAGCGEPPPPGGFGHLPWGEPRPRPAALRTPPGRAAFLQPRGFLPRNDSRGER